jgi:hypothetical protein
MTNFDSLAEHYRQRALRALPRSHAVEGPYSPKLPTSWGDRAVAFVAFAIFMWFVLA